MLQTETSAPSQGAQSFAGLLASLATPAPRRATLIDLDSLEDDVATLSYERALSAHARYRAPQATDRSLTSPPESDSLRIFEAIPTSPPAELSVSAQQIEHESGIAETPVFDRELPQPVDLQPTAAPSRSLLERNLKTASITIRLSTDECDQLRTRAAEAGLTISAYLRSCTFEAESLRAMVRNTMAQLRSDNARPDNARPDNFKDHSPRLSPLAALFAWVIKRIPQAKSVQPPAHIRDGFLHPGSAG